MEVGYSQAKDKQVSVGTPTWLKDIEDKDVAGAIFALIFNWEWEGRKENIANLREYIRESFDDLSDAQVAQVADLLIKHKIIE